VPLRLLVNYGKVLESRNVDGIVIVSSCLSSRYVSEDRVNPFKLVLKVGFTPKLSMAYSRPRNRSRSAFVSEYTLMFYNAAEHPVKLNSCRLYRRTQAQLSSAQLSLKSWSRSSSMSIDSTVQFGSSSVQVFKSSPLCVRKCKVLMPVFCRKGSSWW
jgi:hypothetical protein